MAGIARPAVAVVCPNTTPVRKVKRGSTGSHGGHAGLKALLMVASWLSYLELACYECCWWLPLGLASGAANVVPFVEALNCWAVTQLRAGMPLGTDAATALSSLPGREPVNRVRGESGHLPASRPSQAAGAPRVPGQGRRRDSEYPFDLIFKV